MGRQLPVDDSLPEQVDEEHQIHVENGNCKGGGGVMVADGTSVDVVHCWVKFGQICGDIELYNYVTYLYINTELATVEELMLNKQRMLQSSCSQWPRLSKWLRCLIFLVSSQQMLLTKIVAMMWNVAKL